MKLHNIVTLLSLIAILAGCTTAPTPPPPEQIDLRGVALYYSRSTLGRTDFEQYRLAGDTLYRECGRILGGRHSPQEQEVLSLDQDSVARVKSDAWQIRRFIEERNATFHKPGGNSDFFDSGELTLSLEFPDDTVTVKTSFDSIATPSALREVRANDIAVMLRKAGATAPCGRADFYGLGRKKLGT